MIVKIGLVHIVLCVIISGLERNIISSFSDSYIRRPQLPVALEVRARSLGFANFAPPDIPGDVIGAETVGGRPMLLLGFGL